MSDPAGDGLCLGAVRVGVPRVCDMRRSRTGLRTGEVSGVMPQNQAEVKPPAAGGGFRPSSYPLR